MLLLYLPLTTFVNVDLAIICNVVPFTMELSSRNRDVKELFAFSFCASAFPLNKVIDTAAQRHSKNSCCRAL